MTLTFLAMCFSVIIWAAHLTLVYGAVTVACARAMTPTIMFGSSLPAFAVIVATVIALATIAAGSYFFAGRTGDRSDEIRDEKRFEQRVTQWLALLSAFGVFWAGAAAFFVSPCLGLR